MQVILNLRPILEVVVHELEELLGPVLAQVPDHTALITATLDGYLNDVVPEQSPYEMLSTYGIPSERIWEITEQINNVIVMTLGPLIPPCEPDSGVTYEIQQRSLNSCVVTQRLPPPPPERDTPETVVLGMENGDWYPPRVRRAMGF